jgi:hypothetical protein
MINKADLGRACSLRAQVPHHPIYPSPVTVLACSECGPLQCLSHGDEPRLVDVSGPAGPGRPIIIGLANAWLRASVAAARATVTGR